MSKYQDIKKTIQKMLHKHPEDPTEQPDAEENVSMTEGRKPRIFGINRKIVYGLAGLFIVAFLISLYGNMSDKSDKPKQKKQAETASTAAPTSLQDNLPGDYGTVNRMAGYEAQKNGRTSIPNANSRAATAPRSYANGSPETVVTVPASTGNSAVPPMPSRYYASSYQPTYSTPYQTYPYPVSQTTTTAPSQKAEAAAETMKENVKAAIRFALGEKSEAQQTGTAAATPTNTQSSITPTSTQSPTSVYGSNSYLQASPNMLQVGTLIPAILVTGINSDVGGQVIAQVESDVYDSLYGAALLIPAGSRLIGQYSAGATNGQSRISITWNAVLLPDGGSYNLGGSMIAVDGAGYAGLAGNVDNHTGKVLGAAGFTSALAALGSIAAGNASSTDTTYSAGQLAAQGAMGNLLNTASSMMQKNLNIAPTITINPGYEFNVFVCQPISFNPY